MFRRRRRLIDLTVKQQAGLTAKRAGESWENLLKGEANKQGWAAQKLPDACRTIGANKIIRAKAPFDFILAKAGTAVFLDTKTTKSMNFPHSSIDHRQLALLLELEKEQMWAGYLVNFRTTGAIAFFSAQKLKALKPGQSLSPDEGEPTFFDGRFELDWFLSHAPR